MSETYGKLPLRFEVNQGQTDPSVKFVARAKGYGLFLTQAEAVMVLGGATRPPARASRLGAWQGREGVGGQDENEGRQPPARVGRSRQA